MESQNADKQFLNNPPPLNDEKNGPWNDSRISEEFQQSLQKDLQKRKQKEEKGQQKDKNRHAKYDIQLDRNEAKYIIPESLVPDIREFISPFCSPDPHGKGNPPQYMITTLQLDTPDLALHHAKEHEAINRFKLRVRTYDEPGTGPIFLEVKQKIRGTIMKSRIRIPPDKWSKDLIFSPRVKIELKSKKEEIGFLTFRRLVHEIGARPVVLVRYIRESYFGKLDHYARITFDRKLQYQPTDSWDSWGKNGKWLSMDSSLAQDKDYRFSGVVLEIKTLSDAPRWIIDTVMHFDLERTGNCKYSTAVWLEALFRGSTALPAYADELLSY